MQNRSFLYRAAFGCLVKLLCVTWILMLLAWGVLQFIEYPPLYAPIKAVSGFVKHPQLPEPPKLVLNLPDLELPTAAALETPPEPTNTPSPVPTSRPKPTSTPVPTWTSIPKPTQTPLPPTATPRPPTMTPVPPTPEAYSQEGRLINAWLCAHGSQGDLEYFRMWMWFTPRTYDFATNPIVPKLKNEFVIAEHNFNMMECKHAY